MRGLGCSLCGGMIITPQMVMTALRELKGAYESRKISHQQYQSALGEHFQFDDSDGERWTLDEDATWRKKDGLNWIRTSEAQPQYFFIPEIIAPDAEKGTYRGPIPTAETSVSLVESQKSAPRSVTSSEMRCQFCGAELNRDWEFCADCGARNTARLAATERICPNPKCGQVMPSNKRFCYACGTRLV